MAKDWTRERSATDMARSSLAEKHNATVKERAQEQLNCFNHLLQETQNALVFLREKEVETEWHIRSQVIGELENMERTLHRAIIECKRNLKD